MTFMTVIYVKMVESYKIIIKCTPEFLNGKKDWHLDIPVSVHVEFNVFKDWNKLGQSMGVGDSDFIIE